MQEFSNNYRYYFGWQFFLTYTKMNHYIETNTNTLHVLLLANFAILLLTSTQTILDSQKKIKLLRCKTLLWFGWDRVIQSLAAGNNPRNKKKKLLRCTLWGFFFTHLGGIAIKTSTFVLEANSYITKLHRQQWK